MKEYKFGPIARLAQETPDKDLRDFMLFYGKSIKDIVIVDDVGDSDREWDRRGGGGRVRFVMPNGSFAFVTQSPDCCARHYMHSDAALKDYIGAKLMGAVINQKAEVKDNEGGVLEAMFFKIQTSKGEIDFTSYNSHNGYYGGVGVYFVVLNSLQAKGKFR